MKRDKSVVVEKPVKRYYIYGKGYANNIDAHMQIAKRYVEHLEYKACPEWRLSGDAPYCKFFSMAEMAAIGRFDFFRQHRIKWYQHRYPYREGCECAYCSTVRIVGKSEGMGCWISRMADYRQIARDIIDGKRNDILEMFRFKPKSDETKALPARTA